MCENFQLSQMKKSYIEKLWSMHCNVLKSEIFTLFVYSSRIHSQIKPVCLCTKLGDVQKVPETPAVRPRGLKF